MTDTWNDGLTTFTAIKMNVTDTASDAGSLLLDLKVGGVTKASIDKNGNLTATLTAIDDVPIGATTPSTGAFTTLTASTIDGAVIGGTTAAAGTFTALSASTMDDAVIGGTTPAAGTFTDLESDNIRLAVYSLTGTDIDPANGGIQYKTLAANTTFTESMASGESVILRISGGDTYTVTWPTMSWVTGSGNIAPTLTGSDVVVLWKESTTVYGAYVGSYT